MGETGLQVMMWRRFFRLKGLNLSGSIIFKTDPQGLEFLWKAVNFRALFLFLSTDYSILSPLESNIYSFSGPMVAR